jgi:CRISPR-associated protein Cmr6
MRDVLRKLRGYPDHLGLAHDVWAPIASAQTRDNDPGELDRGQSEGWFERLTGRPALEHYDRALARWTRSLAGPDDVAFHASTQGRLLVGHGNAAPSDVGITLHRTWGVPVIPGSSLAGLLAHYVAATLGPADGPEAERATREPFRPSKRDERGNARDRPGDAYAYLFGVPPHRDDQGKLHAQRGALIMHDALWVPEGDAAPLARDVLTVHQRGYYGGQGCPSDYDSPNPVPFVSVPPGARFVFALSCPDTNWRQWACARLQRALTEWGVGGKTAAGYGRFGGFSDVPVSEHPLVRELGEELEARKQQGTKNKELLEWFEAEWGSRLRGLSARQHDLVAKLLRKYVPSRKLVEQRDRLLALLAEPR